MNVRELIAKQFKPNADNAYCEYIAQLRRPECLGAEAKLKAGEFGKAELDAHVRAGELLGMHRAYHACAVELIAALAETEQGQHKPGCPRTFVEQSTIVQDMDCTCVPPAPANFTRDCPDCEEEVAVTATCPKCGWPITEKGGHGPWCTNQQCKWGWETEMDGSQLREVPVAAPGSAVPAGAEVTTTPTGTPPIGAKTDWQHFEVPVAKTGEFDARAEAEKWREAYFVHRKLLPAIEELITTTYAAGSAANGTQRVTPEMMSEIFAQSIRRRDRDHPHLYDHRIAAELLNKRLAAPSVAPAQVLSELQMEVAAETMKAVECREERHRKGDTYQVKYWGGFLDALGFVSLKMDALRSHTAAGGKGTT